MDITRSNDGIVHEHTSASPDFMSLMQNNQQSLNDPSRQRLLMTCRLPTYKPWTGSTLVVQSQIASLRIYGESTS